MNRSLPAAWSPWRSESPLHGERPGKADLARAIDSGHGREDVLPYPSDAESAGLLRLLIVGINPSPWTAAVNAPFARPGNRFWVSLAAAGILNTTIDASRGLSPTDERLLAARGLGVTNLVSRPTARADELSKAELAAGGLALVTRIHTLRPAAVAILGITAFRAAFNAPRSALGRQPAGTVPRWPEDVQLWVLPNPSGLNAHENVASLAEKWTNVWAASAS